MTLKEDEYLNEADELIYCSKCHTPRQCRVQLGGKNSVRPYGAAVSRKHTNSRRKNGNIGNSWSISHGSRPAACRTKRYGIITFPMTKAIIRKSGKHMSMSPTGRR